MSRDGAAWSRISRQPYVPLGPAGSLDHGQMYMIVGMLRRGDELWQYYFGYDYTHGKYSPAEQRNTGALMRVVQRLDGFASADAAYEGATLTTKPFIMDGGRLELNVDCSAMGTLRAAILNGDGAELAGFGAEDCDLVERSFVAHTVSWRGRSDLSAFRGKPIRLKLEMRACKLYAAQFPAAP